MKKIFSVVVLVGILCGLTAGCNDPAKKTLTPTVTMTPTPTVTMTPTAKTP